MLKMILDSAFRNALWVNTLTTWPENAFNCARMQVKALTETPQLRNASESVLICGGLKTHQPFASTTVQAIVSTFTLTKTTLASSVWHNAHSLITAKMTLTTAFLNARPQEPSTAITKGESVWQDSVVIMLQVNNITLMRFQVLAFKCVLKRYGLKKSHGLV